MKTHPLNDASLFENLIIYETDLMQGKCTNQVLYQIATIYTSLVEYYEGLKDPIF